MRKSIIITALTLLLVPKAFVQEANAQSYTYDSLCHYYMGNFGMEFFNILGMRDGDILVNLGMREYDEQGYYICDNGHELVKLSQSSEGLSVIQSVNLQDEYVTFTLMERNPNGDGYIFADIDRDFDSLTATLHIRHFDETLHFDEDEDVYVLLEDTLSLYQNPWTNEPQVSFVGEQFLIKDNGDIILRYTILTQDPFLQPPYTSPYVTVFARIGTDGTVKDKVALSDTLFDPSHSFFYFGFFNESPEEYFVANRFSVSNEPCMELCVFDSLFRLQRIDTINRNLSDDYFCDFDMCHVVSLDEDSYMIASDYARFGFMNDRGVHVSKYDKATNTNLANAYFLTVPLTEHYGSAHCLGLECSADGNVFFAYCTQDRSAGYVGQVGVAKLDSDMNVIWHRYCLEPTGYIHEKWGCKNTQLLDDGRFVVGSVDFAQGEIFPSPFFLVFTDDGSSDVLETEPLIRPYAYWPNPVKDELHLHYSPDVTPARIELFDLQGEIVHSQHENMERLEMNKLLSGTYTMRVTMNDGKVFTDKVVKE